jgi:hypothetical protein
MEGEAEPGSPGPFVVKKLRECQAEGRSIPREVAPVANRFQYSSTVTLGLMTPPTSTDSP